jgi:hypothetical protein
MVKSVKSEWIGSRIDEDLKELVDEYLEMADITTGQLIRRSIQDYMKRNPMKKEE